MNIRILFLGEIVGRPGLQTIKENLKSLKKRCDINYVVANGEGATGGFGIGKNHAIQLLKMGVDLITTGEKTFFKKEMVDYISTNSKIIRPANYPLGTPGRGIKISEINGIKVAFVTLLGNSNFPRTHLANPYIAATNIIEKIKDDCQAICVQFHATTTAEKQTMAYHLDGKVAAVIGTHSKVLTADEHIMLLKTATITDNGRCGSDNSVGGFDVKIEIERFITQVPSRSKESWENLELQGVIIEIDEQGKAISIERVKEAVPNKVEEPAS